jgi:hypothetical protein
LTPSLVDAPCIVGRSDDDERDFGREGRGGEDDCTFPFDDGSSGLEERSNTSASCTFVVSFFSFFSLSFSPDLFGAFRDTRN